jgi:UDP-N-acetylglucosamine 2-epimerase (non-hydrolysing)
LIRTLFVFGTRPEAIKLAPLILELRSRPGDFSVRVCVTGQHRELLHQVLARFEIVPDADLAVMRRNQSLAGLAGRVIGALDAYLAADRPDLVLVQGDTTSTLAGALTAWYRRVPVGHVEAGLRTGNFDHPFPEEMNRVLTARLTRLHFAPTESARQSLLSEGLADGDIHVTGNTGIDALLFTRAKLESGEWPGFSRVPLDPGKKLVLLTAHRRESHGEGFASICRAVRRLAARGDVEIVYPVHPNPNVRTAVEAALRGVDHIHLVEPQDYVPFVDLMRRACLILTDSGGIQEEAPSLGKPVLVLRETTERPEAVAAGSARLVGTGEESILAEAARCLQCPPGESAFTSLINPFGDGRSCGRIADLIYKFINNLQS